MKMPKTVCRTGLPLVVVCAALLGSRALEATVLWDGDASKGTGVWGSIQVPNGSVTVVDDATYGKAFKIVCNDNGNTKARAEVARFKGVTLQDDADYYIGWSSKWGPLPTKSGKWQVLSQVHLDGPGSMGGPVPFGLSVPGDGKMHFNLQDPGGQSASMWDHSLPLNSWHRYVMHTKVSTSLSDGYCELWYDGVKQTLTNGQQRIPCAMDHADAGYYWKWGVYRSGSGGPIGQSVAYLARVRLATTLAEALPDPPGGGSPTATPTPTPTSPGPTATPTPTPTPTPGGGGFSGYYRLMARHTGKAMVVQSASTADSANVFQWSYGGTNTNDEWELRSIGGGYHRVINRHSGKDLAVQGASTAEGGNILQFTYGGAATNDEWAIVDVGGGFFRVTNRNSGQSAEVVGGGTADGTDVVQRTYGGATHQQWQILRVP
jgi:hypothetical protein